MHRLCTTCGAAEAEGRSDLCGYCRTQRPVTRAGGPPEFVPPIGLVYAWRVFLGCACVLVFYGQLEATLP